MESQLQRLVDGELSAGEYRALLASLDEEPGGWRQCAMAFLESQALTQELGQERAQLRHSLDLPEPEPLRDSIATSNGHAWEKAQVVLAIAASFLLAFGLGLALPTILRFGQEVAGGGNRNEESPVVMTDGRADAGNPLDDMRYVGDVRLLVDGAADGSQAAGRVPVYEVSRDATQFLKSESPALGPELLDLLGKIGYEVRHDEQYFPAPLDDGRQIIVPVEGYQITPVSRRY